MSDARKKLAEAFAVLKPDLSVETIPVSPTVFEELRVMCPQKVVQDQRA